jgi:hypothetical protein
MAELEPTGIGDYDDDGIADLMVRFNREALIAHLDGVVGEVELALSGELIAGPAFEGSDTITVINPGKQYERPSLDTIIGSTRRRRRRRRPQRPAPSCASRGTSSDVR